MAIFKRLDPSVISGGSNHKVMELVSELTTVYPYVERDEACWKNYFRTSIDSLSVFMVVPFGWKHTAF